MPVSKPSQTADWATTAPGPDISPPSGGQQALGWTSGQFPPHNWFNWWQNLVGQWTDYLNDLANQTWTWTAVHTFNLLATFSAGLTAAKSASGAAGVFSGTGGADGIQPGASGGGKAINASGACSFGNTTVGGTLSVSSTASLNGSVTVTGGTTTDTLSVTTLPTPNYVGAGGQPAFASGVSNNTGSQKLCFYKDALGFIHIEGYCNISGAPANQALFTLPASAGWYPATNLVFNCIDSVANPSVVKVLSTGEVHVYAQGGGTLSAAELHIRYHPSITLA